MPNWCSNTFTISHEDPAQMQRLVEAFKAERFFNEFVPNPAGEWEYSWSLENWGTKWDANVGDIDVDENNVAQGWFDTAWAPPIKFYEQLAEQGFKIDATFMEAGMCFAGTWDNESGEDYYEYNFDNENWRDEIDNPIVKDMLESEYDNYLMWKEEEAQDES